MFFLTEMEDAFHDNEDRLSDYQKRIDELNREMLDHLRYIEERSNFYRTCQA